MSVDSGSYDEIALARAEALGALLQAVGYALWQCAECEDSLAHLVIFRLRQSCGVGEKVGGELLAAVHGKTFGQVLREFKEQGILDVALESRLQNLVNERNWLVHRAKRENRGVLNDPAAYEQLAARISALAEDATSLNASIGSQIEEFVVAVGIDRTFIDREAQRIAESWGYN